MKNALLSLTAVAALGVSAVSLAQTCASPLPIQSNSNKTGTTCGGTPGLNLGGTIYPHPSIVYSFVAQNAAAAITFNAAGSPDREMSLVTACNTAPIFIGFNGGPLVIPPATLTNGTTYLLVISTDPGLPPANPPLCGPYNVTVAGTLPVSLQGFSVE
ncbi:MAG: hypothetical protein ABIP44_13955 [Pseudoxanthomonas sp.]